jgi:hypothetical protein
VTDAAPFRYFLCLSVDVQRYSANNDVGQGRVQEDLLAVLDEAGTRAGAQRPEWHRQGKGDEELALIPTEHSARVVDFCGQLATVLREHNTSGAPLRLRLAIDVGPATLAANGFAGTAVIGASRLVGSTPLRNALDSHPDADLVVMLSDAVYRDWVVGGHCAAQPGWFRRVAVSEKEYRGEAWIWVPEPDGEPPDGYDAGWEFLLLAETIRRELDRLSTKHLDHALGYPGTGRAHVADRDLADFVRRSLDELTAITGRLTKLLAPDAITGAVGRPGETGDDARVAHLGVRFAQTYEELLDWAARARGTAVSRSARRVPDALARLADGPIRGVQRFVDDLRVAADEIAGHYRSGGDGHLAIDVPLTLAVDRDALAILTAELGLP